MNTNRLGLVVGIVAGAALLVLAAPRVAPAESAAQTAPAPLRTIHTGGSAVVRVQPDRITVRLGVETFASTPRATQAENARVVAAVLKALRVAGIPPKDIATDTYAIRPDYEYTSRARKIVGYWANNTILVTLSQPAKLSETLTAALEAGATSIDDVTFSTTRLRELRDQARVAAVKAAMEKAGDMAAAAGVAIGEVQAIHDTTPAGQSWRYYGWWGWYSRGRDMGGYANVTQNVYQAATPELPIPEEGEFSLGQIEVFAQVEVVVALR